jgi:hypothetical protein
MKSMFRILALSMTCLLLAVGSSHDENEKTAKPLQRQ